jgi:hypothetical protein
MIGPPPHTCSVTVESHTPSIDGRVPWKKESSSPAKVVAGSTATRPTISTFLKIEVVIVVSCRHQHVAGEGDAGAPGPEKSPTPPEKS